MMSVKQLLIVVGCIAVGVSGYAYLVYNETTQGSDIKTIKETITTTTKDQDAKRDQLGKDFLAKQDQLNAKVSDLTTAVQVQQHDTKTIAETLNKISDQLSAVTISGRTKGKESQENDQ